MSEVENDAELSESVVTLIEMNSSFDESRISTKSTPTDKRPSLLQLICDKKQQTEVVCLDWIKLYTANSDAALIQYMQFVVEASGSQYEIPVDTKRPFDYNSMLIAAAAYFGSRNFHYPLILQTGVTFGQQIVHFVQHLLLVVKNSPIILDYDFFKITTDFIMTFSDSKVRPFRHTSTLIALKYMTTLGEVISSRQEKFKEIWLKMFANVFLERSNDIVDEIRYLCIVECGRWLEKYPRGIVSRAHANHLFPPLQDTSCKVIESSLRALLRIYDNTELRSVCLRQGMEYRVVLFGLTMSTEGEVSMLALQLLIGYYKSKSEILDSTMIELIEQLVFAAHRDVAQAAAELVTYHYRDACTDNERILKFVLFLMKFRDCEHAAYFVDSFYGRNKIVLAWSNMVTMLLADPIYLDYQQGTVLIEILNKSVRQAVTGEIPPGRYTENLARQPQPNAPMHATRDILRALPKLLSKYSSYSQNLINLLELPQYMHLGTTETHELLDQIKDITLHSENIGVMRMGAMTLDHLYNLSMAHAQHRDNLLDAVVESYMTAMSDWDQSAELNNSDTSTCTKRLVIALRLVSAIYDRFDMNDCLMSDLMLSTLQRAVGLEQGNSVETSLPIEAMQLHLVICYVDLAWDLKRIEDSNKLGKNVIEICVTLKKQLRKYFKVTFHLIEHPRHTDLDNDAFVYTCDLLVLFGDYLRHTNNTSIWALEYKSKISEHDLLEKYLMQYVFDFENEDSAMELTRTEMFPELQSKRRVLSSYSKLIFQNIMPAMRACIIYQHYEHCHAIYGDIMHATMERSLGNNAVNFGMAVMHTCLLPYKRISTMYENRVNAAASPEFENLLKLARMLAELFNIKPLEVRPGILILHRAGIRFAAELQPDDPAATPKDLLYLTVLEQFVPQLLAQDMLDIYKYLDIIDQALPSSRAEDWQPLTSYRNCLETSIRQSCRRTDLHDVPNYVAQ